MVNESRILFTFESFLCHQDVKNTIPLNQVIFPVTVELFTIYHCHDTLAISLPLFEHSLVKLSILPSKLTIATL